MRHLLILLLTLSVLLPGNAQPLHCTIAHGGVVRTDSTKKVISLVFTGHAFADGYPTINFVLDHYGIKASFFFTGDFYRNPDFQKVIRGLKKDGHYLGAHSDKQLLYCSWEDRDHLLVSKDSFLLDLENNFLAMKKYGIRKKDAPFFMPPFGQYNSKISRWTQEYGLTLVNFSPGTHSNADHTYPDMGKQYLDSETIMESILAYERENRLNGFILLMHMGTDQRRKDKLYHHLDELLTKLQLLGYSFQPLWESMPDNLFFDK